MRRLLLVFLLAFARDALAARAMVVDVVLGVSDRSLEHSQKLMAVYKTVYGIDFDHYAASDMTTLWLVNAEHRGPEGVKNYDFLIIHNYRKGGIGGGSFGANVDSMFRDPSGNARWPTKPTLIFSDPAFAGSLGPSSFGMDSTGFGGSTAPSALAWPTRVIYSPELSRGWHSGGSTARFSRVAAPGVVRDVLLDLPSPWWSYTRLLPNGFGGVSGSAGWSTPDWDSVSALSASDSGVIRVRYRADGAGNGLPPPVAFVACGNAIDYNIRLVTVGLALADSAGLNTLLFQTRPGPVMFTVQMNTIGATGRYDAADGGGIVNDYGIFVPAGIDSDRANSVATIDALAARGVKMSFGVQMNPDSVAKLRYQLEWIRDRDPYAKVYPFERSGLGDYSPLIGGAESAGGNADATHNYDAFGAMRQRSLLPADCADPRLGCDCSTDTTSVLCLAQRQKAAAVAFFGADRLDAVWSVPAEDWTPRYFGRSGGDLDSLVWVLYRFVGLRGLRVGNMSVVNIANDGSANSPRGWMRNQAVRPVKDPATGQVIGQFAFLPSRDAENPGPGQIQSGGHDNASEFLTGLTLGMWFEGTPSPIYVNGHDFFNRTMIFETPASWLGGSGDPRYNWHAALNYIADFDDFCKLTKRLAGRPVIEMGYGEDTASWFIRSGLR